MLTVIFVISWATQMRMQLNYVYNQILFVLTYSQVHFGRVALARATYSGQRYLSHRNVQQDLSLLSACTKTG